MNEEFTDRDRLADMLLFTRSISGSYHSAALDCATPKIRSAMMELHDRELEHAERLLNAMEKRGWYRPEPAAPGR